MFCPVSSAARSYLAFTRYATCGQPVLLAVLRLWFGYGFVKAGLGKLQNIANTASYFGGLGIPAPELNAWMAGTTEFIGGALLLLGAGSRAVAIPLIFTMLVAYSTQHIDEFRTLWTIAPAAAYNPRPSKVQDRMQCFDFGAVSESVDLLWDKWEDRAAE